MLIRYRFFTLDAGCALLSLRLAPEGEAALVPGVYQLRSMQSPGSGSPMETPQQGTKTETKPFLGKSRLEKGCLLTGELGIQKFRQGQLGQGCGTLGLIP